MTRMISIARIDRAKLPADPVATHNSEFGTYATMLAMFPHAGDPSQVAALFEVHDVDGMRRETRTPEGDAKLRATGFVEQLEVYYEG